jgi:hypothetical protein
MIPWILRRARDVRRELRQLTSHARLCYGEQRRLGVGSVGPPYGSSAQWSPRDAGLRAGPSGHRPCSCRPS